MAWVEIFVRAPEAINNPQAIKRIDDELTRMAPACFDCSSPSGMPVQEKDGTWGMRVFDATHLDWVKRIIMKHKLEVIREERHD